MKLKPAQLSRHLKQGLAAVYFITGDEPLQETECTDAIRQAARTQGFTERTVFTVENRQFDWNALIREASSLSLFAGRRMFEVRLGDKFPADSDSRNFANVASLTEYLSAPPKDTLLLITAAKLDSKKQKTKWFEALERNGVILELLIPEPAQMPQWIQERLAGAGLQASPEAVTLLAERSEGHLLAAAQEIEKLRLLHGTSARIEAEQVLDAVADSARFEIYGWVDTVLAGDSVRLTRHLHGLRTEGFDPILIIWLLTQEIRNLAQIAYAVKNGEPQPQAFQRFRVWRQRQNAVSQALKRHALPRWWRFLQQAVKLDHMSKGAAPGNTWDELLKLALQVAGVRMP